MKIRHTHRIATGALPGCLVLSSSMMLSLPLTAQEESSWQFGINAGLQYKNYQFDQSFRTANGSEFNRDLNANIPTLSLAFGVSYAPFYLAVKYEDALAAGSTGETRDFSDDFVENDIKRRDFTLTLGYNVWAGLDLMLGYLYGETELDTTGVIDEEFEESGPFLGVSYGWTIGEAGSLSASLAYAFMDGKTTLTDTQGGNFTGGEREQVLKGDSQGFSLGATWAGPITHFMGYYLDLRYQQYNFESDDSGFSDFTIDEGITTGTVGLQFRF